MHEPLGGPLEGGIVAYVSVIWWNVTPFFIQELPHIVWGEWGETSWVLNWISYSEETGFMDILLFMWHVFHMLYNTATQYT